MAPDQIACSERQYPLPCWHCLVPLPLKADALGGWRTPHVCPLRGLLFGGGRGQRLSGSPGDTGSGLTRLLGGQYVKTTGAPEAQNTRRTCLSMFKPSCKAMCKGMGHFEVLKRPRFVGRSFFEASWKGIAPGRRRFTPGAWAVVAPRRSERDFKEGPAGSDRP